MDKIPEWARKLRISPLFWGVLICYVGQFVSTLIAGLMSIGTPAVDIVSHPELAAAPPHEILRPLVTALITLAGVFVAGYVSAMFAGENVKAHALVVGVLFALFSAKLCLDTSHRLEQTGIDTFNTWGDWAAAALTVPVAFLGAIQYLRGVPASDAK